MRLFRNGWTLVFCLLLTAGMLTMFACDDDDDDDDDDGDPWAQFPITFSGTMSYDGSAHEAEGTRIMIAITDEWPMEGAPLWFGYVEIPADGFPFDYKIGVDQPFVGEYYVIASIDVDPTDGYMPDFDTDPLAIPDERTGILEGDNPIDFVFEEYNIDDDVADDDVADDDVADDDVTDDDTVDKTGISGELIYLGAAAGETVVFGFWSGVPMGPPDHTDEIDVAVGGFPFDYEIETAFTGEWKVVAFLDVDPLDGSSINLELDPSNFSLLPPYPTVTIVDGQMTDFNIELLDP